MSKIDTTATRTPPPPPPMVMTTMTSASSIKLLLVLLGLNNTKVERILLLLHGLWAGDDVSGLAPLVLVLPLTRNPFVSVEGNDFLYPMFGFSGPLRTSREPLCSWLMCPPCLEPTSRPRHLSFFFVGIANVYYV
jgi:hypothetical protein